MVPTALGKREHARPVQLDGPGGVLKDFVKKRAPRVIGVSTGGVVGPVTQTRTFAPKTPQLRG